MSADWQGVVSSWLLSARACHQCRCQALSQSTRCKLSVMTHATIPQSDNCTNSCCGFMWCVPCGNADAGFVLQKLKAVGCPSVEAPDRAEPPPIADVRYVSMSVSTPCMHYTAATTGHGKHCMHGQMPTSHCTLIEARTLSYLHATQNSYVAHGVSCHTLHAV